MSFRKLGEFPTGGGHVSEKLFGGVESGIDGTCKCACCFNIALPVITDDDTAFTPFVSELQQFILA